MKTIKQELYSSLVDDLLDKENGLDLFCWFRRRTNAHYEHAWPGQCLEGSSDVSGYMYQLWIQYGEDSLDEKFGFWINGEICEIVGVPNVKAVREYHNVERA